MFEARQIRPANIVRLDIDDTEALYGAYMPFVTNGGIFVHAHELGDMHYALGTDIHVLLHLRAKNERVPVHGRIVWITPWNHFQRATGVGVQFLDNGEVQHRIEGLLSGTRHSERPTLTL